MSGTVGKYRFDLSAYPNLLSLCRVLSPARDLVERRVRRKNFLIIGDMPKDWIKEWTFQPNPTCSSVGYDKVPRISRIVVGGGAAFGRGSLGRGNFGCGSIGRGSLGRGNLGRGSLDRGNLGRGSLDRGNLGRGSLDRGSMGLGSLAGSSLGLGEIGLDSVGRGSVGRGSIGRSSLFRSSLFRGSLFRGSLGHGSLFRGSLGHGGIGLEGIDLESIYVGLVDGYRDYRWKRYRLQNIARLAVAFARILNRLQRGINLKAKCCTGGVHRRNRQGIARVNVRLLPLDIIRQ